MHIVYADTAIRRSEPSRPRGHGRSLPQDVNHVISDQPGREREIAARVGKGMPPFTLADFLLFGERDAAAHPALYMRPDYWLYFPTDQRVPFDRKSPDCRTDYLTALLRSARIGRPGPDVSVSHLGMLDRQVRPGDIVTVSGMVTDNRGRKLQADLLHDGVPVAPLIFNCQAGDFVGEYQVPTTLAAGV